MSIENPFNQTKEQHEDTDPKNRKPSHQVSFSDLLSPEWESWDGNFQIMDHDEEEKFSLHHEASLAPTAEETMSRHEREEAGGKLKKRVWSKLESKLLHLLSENPQKIFSKEDIAKALYGEDEQNSPRFISNLSKLVGRCNKKRDAVPLELNEFGAFEIQSVSGKGYKLIYKESAEITLGELVRSARRGKGLTQNQLASLSKTTQKAISDIEQDARKPANRLFLSLISVLNLDIKKLPTVL